MRAVMLPLVVEIGETQKTLPVRRLEDYHTVKDTLKASGTTWFARLSREECSQLLSHMKRSELVR